MLIWMLSRFSSGMRIVLRFDRSGLSRLVKNVSKVDMKVDGSDRRFMFLSLMLVVIVVVVSWFSVEFSVELSVFELIV